jgi:glycosyltransferase involved in cell wall biosynthesis
LVGVAEMIQIPSTQGKPLRALLLGPVLPPDVVSGLHLALDDVVTQLAARGWRVNNQIWTTSADEDNFPGVSLKNSFLPSRLAAFQRKQLMMAAWDNAVPPTMRRILSTTFMPRAYFEQISHNLRAADQLMREARQYDAVLFCINGAPPGMGALITNQVGHAAVISLYGLGDELESNWWPWARVIARRHLGKQMHPFVFRRIEPAKVSMAIFASAQWQREAIRAGLPEHKARTIYFGIPEPQTQPRSSPSRNRLLWVGRVSREKGLHQLLRALPMIRQRVSDVTLTVIGDLGSAGYPKLIKELTARYHLEDLITFLPSRKRADLQTAYATHDVLVFHSIFAEPVALVLMEAFAAGLPVVASKACRESKLVRDQVTCLCYRHDSPESLRDAVVTMLTRPDQSRDLAGRARQLMGQEFTLGGMGRAYDEALRQLVSGGR